MTGRETLLRPGDLHCGRVPQLIEHPQGSVRRCRTCFWIGDGIGRIRCAEDHVPYVGAQADAGLDQVTKVDRRRGRVPADSHFIAVALCIHTGRWGYLRMSEQSRIDHGDAIYFDIEFDGRCRNPTTPDRVMGGNPEPRPRGVLSFDLSYIPFRQSPGVKILLVRTVAAVDAS